MHSAWGVIAIIVGIVLILWGCVIIGIDPTDFID